MVQLESKLVGSSQCSEIGHNQTPSIANKDAFHFNNCIPYKKDSLELSSFDSHNITTNNNDISSVVSTEPKQASFLKGLDYASIAEFLDKKDLPEEAASVYKRALKVLLYGHDDVLIKPMDFSQTFLKKYDDTTNYKNFVSDFDEVSRSPAGPVDFSINSTSSSTTHNSTRNGTRLNGSRHKIALLEIMQILEQCHVHDFVLAFDEGRKFILNSIYNHLGTIYYRLGLVDNAYEYYLWDVKLSMMNNDKMGQYVAWGNVANCFKRYKRYILAASALKCQFSCAVDMDYKEGQCQTFYSLAKIYYITARHMFGIEGSPNSPTVKRFLQKAIQSLNNAQIIAEQYHLDLMPPDELNYLCGNIYFFLKHFQASIDHFSKLLHVTAIDRSKADIYSKIGNCHIFLGNFLEASRAYAKAMEIDPERATKLTVTKNTDVHDGKPIGPTHFFAPYFEMERDSSLTLSNTPNEDSFVFGLSGPNNNMASNGVRIPISPDSISGSLTETTSATVSGHRDNDCSSPIKDAVKSKIAVEKRDNYASNQENQEKFDYHDAFDEDESNITLPLLPIPNSLGKSVEFEKKKNDSKLTKMHGETSQNVDSCMCAHGSIRLEHNDSRLIYEEKLGNKKNGHAHNYGKMVKGHSTSFTSTHNDHQNVITCAICRTPEISMIKEKQRPVTQDDSAKECNGRETLPFLLPLDVGSLFDQSMTSLAPNDEVLRNQVETAYNKAPGDQFLPEHCVDAYPLQPDSISNNFTHDSRKILKNLTDQLSNKSELSSQLHPNRTHDWEPCVVRFTAPIITQLAATPLQANKHSNNFVDRPNKISDHAKPCADFRVTASSLRDGHESISNISSIVPTPSFDFTSCKPNHNNQLIRKSTPIESKIRPANHQIPPNPFTLSPQNLPSSQFSENFQGIMNNPAAIGAKLASSPVKYLEEKGKKPEGQPNVSFDGENFAKGKVLNNANRATSPQVRADRSINMNQTQNPLPTPPCDKTIISASSAASPHSPTKKALASTNISPSVGLHFKDVGTAISPAKFTDLQQGSNRASAPMAVKSQPTAGNGMNVVATREDRTYSTNAKLQSKISDPPNTIINKQGGQQPTATKTHSPSSVKASIITAKKRPSMEKMEHLASCSPNRPQKITSDDKDLAASLPSTSSSKNNVLQPSLSREREEADLYELVSNFQSHRMNDQRCDVSNLPSFVGPPTPDDAENVGQEQPSSISRNSFTGLKNDIGKRLTWNLSSSSHNKNSNAADTVKRNSRSSQQPKPARKKWSFFLSTPKPLLPSPGNADTSIATAAYNQSSAHVMQEYTAVLQSNLRASTGQAGTTNLTTTTKGEPSKTCDSITSGFKKPGAKF